MTLRLGDLLVQLGTLTREQCDTVLREQQRSNRPFGVLAEKMFHIEPDALERAWAEQYASIAERIDPAVERYDLDVIRLISKRQAWQFRLLPLRRDGNEIMVCSSTEHLARALRFAYRHIGPSCYFVTCDSDQLLTALERYYPMPGAREALAMDSSSR
jgi:hypothetical protein